MKIYVNFQRQECSTKFTFAISYPDAFLFTYPSIYPYLATPIGHISSDILTLHGSYDVFLQPLVPFGGHDEIAPHLGSQIPPKTHFKVVNRRFQAKLVKSKNMHIIKTAASIPTKFCTAIKTTQCPSWVVRTHTHNESKMANGRLLEKSPYLGRGLANFDQNWHSDAVRLS